MRFFIFTDSFPIVKCNTKDAKYSSMDFEQASKEYEKLCDSCMYNNIYLIMDFGTWSSRALSCAKASVLDAKFPYIIIGEYHIDDTTADRYRKDTLVLNSKGFIHSFTDNKLAIEKFMYFVDNKINCTLSFKLDYNQKQMVKNRNRNTQDGEISIVDSIAIIRNKGNFIKKIIINPFVYCPDRMVRIS